MIKFTKCLRYKSIIRLRHDIIYSTDQINWIFLLIKALIAILFLFHPTFKEKHVWQTIATWTRFLNRSKHVFKYIFAIKQQQIVFYEIINQIWCHRILAQLWHHRYLQVMCSLVTLRFLWRHVNCSFCCYHWSARTIFAICFCFSKWAFSKGFIHQTG